jgi:hypothetical protein
MDYLTALDIAAFATRKLCEDEGNMSNAELVTHTMALVTATRVIARHNGASADAA